MIERANLNKEQIDELTNSWKEFTCEIDKATKISAVLLPGIDKTLKAVKNKVHPFQKYINNRRK